MGSKVLSALKLIWFVLCVAVLLLLAWNLFGLIGAGILIIAFGFIGRYAVGLERIAIGTGLFDCDHTFVHKIDTSIYQCSKCGV